MRRRICILLAAVLLLLCLSGISAGAENQTFFYNEKTKKWVSGNGTNVQEVTVVWTIQNNDILVEAKRQWNPFALRYDVTEISVTDFCSPQITFTITNNSKQYYCSSTVQIESSEDFSVSVLHSLNVIRTDANLKLSPGDYDGTKLFYLDRNVTENIEVVNNNDGQSVVIGPWLTAITRDYYNQNTIIESDVLGESRVSFTLTIENDTLLNNLRTIENWNGSTYKDGNTITIANVTIVLDMIAIPTEFDIPSS